MDSQPLRVSIHCTSRYPLTQSAMLDSPKPSNFELDFEALDTQLQKLATGEKLHCKISVALVSQGGSCFWIVGLGSEAEWHVDILLEAAKARGLECKDEADPVFVKKGGGKLQHAEDYPLIIIGASEGLATGSGYKYAPVPEEVAPYLQAELLKRIEYLKDNQ